MDGKAGNDSLEGGAENDKLIGGEGDDQLFGGVGDDTMDGGLGADSYVIQGNDTIEDSDGVGNIKDMAGKRIAGLINKRADGSYVFEPDASVGVTGNGADITLTLASGDSVTIKDFGTGTLGLTLSKEPTAAPTTSRTIVGDLAPVDFDLATAGVQTRKDELGNTISDPNQPDPGRVDGFRDSAGNDLIQGLGGNDAIVSLAGGDDRIEGGSGDDWLIGGAGNDIVVGGSGRDAITEGSGDDKLYAGEALTVTQALAAQDAAASGLVGDALSGGSGDDLLMGSNGNDALLGGTGADILIAGAGDDDIRGDWMADNILPDWTAMRSVTTDASGVTYRLTTYYDFNSYSPTAGGDDVIYAGAGVDWVNAEYGDDYIDGGSGNDVLVGNVGNDDIFGGTGDDVMVGDDYVALIYHGDDYLDGEEGDDTLYGEGGSDELFGGTGNDRLYAEQGDDYLDGEDGNDILLGGEGDDAVFGGTGADYLQGDAGNGVGDGDDYLDGEAGDDVLLGLGGQDEIHGGDGADQIVGDNGGSDTSGAADTIYGEAGNDSIDGQGGDDVIDAGADNDLVLGGLGNDQIAGGTGDDELQGGEGDDVLDGGDGSDVLFGEAGNDSLGGGADTDYLIGGLGDDVLAGGEGDDVYYYTQGDGNDRIVDAGGTDWLVFNDINWGQVQLGVGSLKLAIPGGEIHLDDFDPDNPFAAGGIEYFQFADGVVMSKNQLISTLGFTPTGTPEADVLSGTALADTIRALAGDDVITARGGNDTVYADEGVDVVYGGEGDDLLYGGLGDDVLLGEAGNDTLYGDAGNDLLSGGAGTDQLMGGEGNDTYLFQSGDGQDTVTDALGLNTIALGAGLTLDAIVFGKQGNDLLVAIKNSADRLTVKDWYVADSHFASVTLGDGSVLDHAAVQAAMPKNQAPLAALDSASVTEDSVLSASGNALANDSDPEGRVLRITSPGSFAGVVGTLALSSNGAYSYALANGSTAVQSLAAGQRLTERFAYTVTDDDPTAPATAESAIVVTVLGSNDLPVLGADSASTDEDAGAITGNVLSNDRDVDAGTTLSVANPGTRTSAYGALSLGANGAWTYTLANGASAVQSLTAGQTVTDNFAFKVSDGVAQVGGNLSVAIAGRNDAPILATALADQAAAANTSWAWTVPVGSFTDVDAGEVLAYGATLSDGTALPSWLTFNAATQSFSGRVPKTAIGSMDIKVAVADRAGASASDVFTLAFAAGTGGGGGGSGGNGGGGSGGGGGNTGVGSLANQGVGNGVDAAPPGQTVSFNDGAGSSPGNPGGKGGNGYVPPSRASLVIGTVVVDALMTQAPSPTMAVVHGQSATALAAAPGQSRPVTQDAAVNPGITATDAGGANTETARNAPRASVAPDNATQSTDTKQAAFLPAATWTALGGQTWSADEVSGGGNGDSAAVFARWLAVQQAMARDTANKASLPAWLNDAQGADLRGMLITNGGLLGANQATGVDTVGLGAGANLKVFQGLGRGVQQIA